MFPTGAFRVGATNRNLFEPALNWKLFELNHTLDNYFEIYDDEFVHVVAKRRKLNKRSFVLSKDVKQICQVVVRKCG